MNQHPRGDEHATHIGNHPAHIRHHREGGHFSAANFVVAALIISFSRVAEWVVHPDLDAPIDIVNRIDQLDIGGIVLGDVRA